MFVFFKKKSNKLIYDYNLLSNDNFFDLILIPNKFVFKDKNNHKYIFSTDGGFRL